MNKAPYVGDIDERGDDETCSKLVVRGIGFNREREREPVTFLGTGIHVYGHSEVKLDSDIGTRKSHARPFERGEGTHLIKFWRKRCSLLFEQPVSNFRLASTSFSVNIDAVYLNPLKFFFF